MKAGDVADLRGRLAVGRHVDRHGAWHSAAIRSTSGCGSAREVGEDQEIELVGNCRHGVVEAGLDFRADLVLAQMIDPERGLLAGAEAL